MQKTQHSAIIGDKRRMGFTSLTAALVGLFVLGCETLPEPPDKGAIYRTEYETWTVENTTAKEFCDQMTDNKEIIEGAYRDGDNKTRLEKSE